MQRVTNAAELTVENVGGIDEAEVSMDPGVVVLSGRNATNRTSLLRALMGVLGSDDTTLKGDANSGRVDLELDGERYTRTLERSGTGVAMSGDPYLEDPTVADLFAFLLESNEARRAVARGDDLYEILMRPVDTAAIEAEIENLQSRREEIDDELAAIDEQKQRLPDLEARRTELEEEIVDKREELEEIEAELDAAEVDPERRKAEKEELERKLDELRARRSDLEDVRHRIDTERESIESLREERTELETELDETEAELDELEAPADVDDDISSKLDSLRSEKNELDSEITDLQNVISFNEEFLDSDGLPAEERGDDDGSVTEELLPEPSQVTCWTCGSEVDPGRIEETIDRLRDQLEDKLASSRRVQSRIDDLKEKRQTIENKRSRRNAIERKIDDIEAEIQDRKERIDEAKRRREQLSSAVEELEAEVESLESEEFEEILDLHRRANRVEFELERAEEDRSEIEAEIESIESRLESAEDLRERRETVTEQLEECRTRVERLERQAVEAFNDHMDTLLEVLDYDNVARIWIERSEETVREGRQKTTKSTFDLHVVRRTENGTTYEDTVDHLSESEREVTGLVFALAGYLVHDVHEEVPFMILDSLESIDAERIATLVDHFRQYTEFLVVALLEEDAKALEEAEHTTITAF